LIEDRTLAERHLNLFFEEKSNPTLENGFKLLVARQNEEATQQFKDYLNFDHRSTTALVGIALSTATMAISNTDELLMRAIRLDPEFSPAYLSLGMQYLKKKNYPMAEKNFKQAVALSSVPEYKILLGRLYLEINQPGIALNLLQGEAEKAPDNFYFNFLTARALLRLNRFDEMGRYIEAALEANPDNSESKLLLAKYNLNQNNLQRARLILSGLKFEGYNEDYIKTYAHVLVKLKDKKARNYLYEFFSRKKWDKDINLLLGLYHLWMMGKGNVQNWIYRSILAGVDIKRLKELFPGKYKFPEYRFLPFFDVKKMKWISDEKVLVVATRESGEWEKIFIVELDKMRIIQEMTYNGRVQEIFISKNRNSIIFSSTAEENKSVYLYAIDLTERSLRLSPVFGRPLNMASVIVGFSNTGTMAYITDSKINALAFESPFSQVSQYEQKKPVYPKYPFPIYKYNFATRSMEILKDMRQTGVVPPIEGLRKYAMVVDAFGSNSQIQALIIKGQMLDLTSTEVVKIHFPKDLTSFIIYLSDTNNAFQGVAWNSYNNQMTRIDETMFLGKGNYAELTVVDFNPRKKELMVLTKNQKELILYNYDSHIYIRLAKNVANVLYNRNSRMVYVLNVSGNKEKRYFGGRGLQIISLNPFLIKQVGTRMGLNDIIACGSESEVYFSTYNGEIVKMDDEYKFSYVKPSLEGSEYADSPSGKKTAALINGRLIIIE
jgi:tetratricopeptide (TPR) repeat protein